MSTTEIKAGDRVRATPKNNPTNDTFEFTVLSTNGSSLYSALNYWGSNSFDFEVITPPVPTANEQYLAFAPGTRFRFENTTVEYTKIDDRFMAMDYGPGTEPRIRTWMHYSGTPHPLVVVNP
jgi:uncharacterized phage infection (PIP) family protein YhgE